MSPASVNAIVHRQSLIDPSSSQATPSSTSSTAMVTTTNRTTSTSTSSQLRLRDFMPDEDAKNFGSAILKTIDQTAFIRAQGEALEAFQVAKALKLSEKTAAVERERRKASTAVVANQQIMEAPVPSSSASHPIPIKRGAAPRDNTTASDEAAARSLARSWRVDGLQPALLAKPALVLSSGPSSFSFPSSSSAPSSKPRSFPPSRDDTNENVAKKASGSTQKQPSQTIPSASDLRPSRAPTTQTNSVSYYSAPSDSATSAPPPPKVQTQPQRAEPRSHSKREPSTGADESTPSSSRAHISDMTNTKRRRTESKQSISTSNQDTKMLLASPISEPKKSSASARDVRQGRLVAPAKENSDASVAGSDSRSRRRTIYEISSNSSNVGLLTATRTCAKCGNAVASPRGQFSVLSDPSSSSSPTFAELLHVTCSNCVTSHCRGCFAVVRCPRACSGGHGSDDSSSCSVRNCCPSVHTIALFEALSGFDAVYATEPGLSKLSTTAGANKAHRQTFLKSLVTKTDKNLRKFEDAFVRTLRILSSWLQGPVVDDGQLHPIVTRLFEASLLPEVIHAFLSSTNVRDWIAHSETYLAILDTLRRMFDCGLQQALTQPLNHIDRSCGLGEWVWDRGIITWQVDQLNGRVVQSMALCELVKQLESHRRPLMALAAKVQFPGTLEKVNALCDGISYLLLQQAVGIN